MTSPGSHQDGTGITRPIEWRVYLFLDNSVLKPGSPCFRALARRHRNRGCRRRPGRVHRYAHPFSSYTGLVPYWMIERRARGSNRDGGFLVIGRMEKVSDCGFLGFISLLPPSAPSPSPSHRLHRVEAVKPSKRDTTKQSIYGLPRW